MIVLPGITEGFSFQRTSYDDFVAENLPVEGCAFHDLGESEWPGKNIYGISYGDLEEKPVVFIQGGLHGNEWSPPYYLVEFMKIIANPPNNEMKPVIERLKKKFSFFLIPIANPWGFDVANSKESIVRVACRQK